MKKTILTIFAVISIASRACASGRDDGLIFMDGILSGKGLAQNELNVANSFVSDISITKKVLADIESNGRWYVVNSEGCGGRFQFCPKTRRYVIKKLGILSSEWMKKENQVMMFDYLFYQYREEVSSLDLPDNIWFLYGAWQSGPTGIKIISDTLRYGKRLRADVQKGIRRNLSGRDKKVWENKTRKVMLSIWNSGSMRKEGRENIIVKDGGVISDHQKRVIRRGLTKEGFAKYKTESDMILASIWADKFSKKIKMYSLKY